VATNSHWVEASQISLPIQPTIENKTDIADPHTKTLESLSLFILFNFTFPHPPCPTIILARGVFE